MTNVRRGTIFPVVDSFTPEERKRLGGMRAWVSLGIPAHNVGAIWTGEKRPPRQGEWYLSGSVVEAYRARNDLDTPYHIARLVKTRTVTTTIIIGD